MLPTLEAETLDFLYVQRSLLFTVNSADALSGYSWSGAFTSVWFGHFQDLAVHSGRYCMGVCVCVCVCVFM